jgi:hypothetical protein
MRNNDTGTCEHNIYDADEPNKPLYKKLTQAGSGFARTALRLQHVPLPPHTGTKLESTARYAL